MRKHLQKIYLNDWERIKFPSWPVDRTVDQILERLLTLMLRGYDLDSIPFIWFWPVGYPILALSSTIDRSKHVGPNDLRKRRVPGE